MNHYQVINEMKKMMSIMFILMLTPALALATSAFIEYEGTGSMTIQTEILSDTKPDMNDEVNAYAPPCPCCEDDCDEGSYEGYQYVTNSPYGLIEDYGEVDNGCISFDQEIIHDKEGNQEITTNYQVLVDGDGMAYSIAVADPYYGSGYQYVDGSGNAWIYYGQSSEIDGEFDYNAEYSVGRLGCDSGYFEMGTQYELMGPFAYHNGFIEAVCDDTGCYYIYFLGEATDIFGSNIMYQTQYMSYASEVNVEGYAYLNTGIVTDDDSSIDFELVVG